MLAIPGDFNLEHTIHTRLKVVRLHGEWFDYTPEVKALIDTYRQTNPEDTMRLILTGLQVNQTITAEMIEQIKGYYMNAPDALTNPAPDNCI